jgi:hypothetical protein
MPAASTDERRLIVKEIAERRLCGIALSLRLCTNHLPF